MELMKALELCSGLILQKTELLIAQAEAQGEKPERMIAVLLLNPPVLIVSLMREERLREELASDPTCPAEFAVMLKAIVDMGESPPGIMRMVVSSPRHDPSFLLYKRAVGLCPEQKTAPDPKSN